MRLLLIAILLSQLPLLAMDANSIKRELAKAQLEEAVQKAERNAEMEPARKRARLLKVCQSQYAYHAHLKATGRRPLPTWRIWLAKMQKTYSFTDKELSTGLDKNIERIKRRETLSKDWRNALLSGRMPPEGFKPSSTDWKGILVFFETDPDHPQTVASFFDPEVWYF